MAVMHWAAMKYMRQVGASRGTENQELAVATATKLARTFTGQMEALKRYRTGGEQKVTVQHVSVNEGGHAIVGHVTHTKSRMPVLKKSKDETPALTDSRQAAMPMLGDLDSERKAWLEYAARKKLSP